MSNEFSRNYFNRGVYHQELPPHLPRVRPADRDKVLSFLEQTRSEQRLFEANEISPATKRMRNNSEQVDGTNTSIWDSETTPTTVDLVTRPDNISNDIDSSSESPETAQ